MEHAHRSNIDANIIIRDAWKIRDAMPQAISIDNFIDAHSANPGVVISGKLGIAQAILEAERNSRLSLGEEWPGQKKQLDHGKMPGTWYLPFFQLLTENVRREDVDKLFDNVSFVTFNYDRCIEHYLYHAIQNYYGVQDVERLLQALKICHPYGVVGCLPWQDPHTHVSFGGLLRNANLIDLANQLRTFTERVEG